MITVNVDLGTNLPEGYHTFTNAEKYSDIGLLNRLLEVQNTKQVYLHYVLFRYDSARIFPKYIRDAEGNLIRVEHYSRESEEINWDRVFLFCDQSMTIEEFEKYIKSVHT